MKSDFPLPDTELESTRGFWEAASRDVLAIPRCGSCGRFQWYPRERCPACEGVDWSWTTMSGSGSLYSWAVVRRALARPVADKVPYVPGLVALEEDPAVRIVTNLVDCEPDDLQVDMPNPYLRINRRVHRGVTFGQLGSKGPAL